MNRAQQMLGELNRALQQQQEQQQQQQQQQNENVQVEDDHDEDEDEEEEDDGIDRDADGVLDGGVAGGVSNADDSSTAARKSSQDCELLLYITCAETMEDIAKNHPILKEGVCVSIGLDKSTKLGAVFSRYAEFCNEHSKTKIEDSDLEFFHCQLLNSDDTAEASALMKNDKIQVRKERSAERETQQELKRLQRESDREYFKQLRHIMPDCGGRKLGDVIFDCQGKIVDESGRNQQVLSTTVRGNSVLLEKRCRWLGDKIQAAREERKRQNLMTLPRPNQVKIDEDEDGHEQDQSCVSIQEANNIVANPSSGSPEDVHHSEIRAQPKQASGIHRDDDTDEHMDEEEEEEDDDEILGYPVPKNRPQVEEPMVARAGGATEIENDDDDDDSDDDDDASAASENHRGCRSRSPVMASSEANQQRANNSNMLWVPIPNHSPEALKLLLEYCYTNRVVPLGQDAFVQSCKTKPTNSRDGPVSPFAGSRRWPNGGLPQVSFSVALAGIAIAEEAGLHRLSLMCEVAASNLVSSSNAIEALSMCTRQREATGNPLPRLREVAMFVVLRGIRQNTGIQETPMFRRAVEQRSTSIVPTLFSGLENVCKSDKKKDDDKVGGEKRKFSAFAENFFHDMDREDVFRRERERRQRRLERWEKNPELASMYGSIYDREAGDYVDPVVSGAWAAEAARKSLKRMTHNINVGNLRHIDDKGSPRSPQARRGVQHGGMRRHSSSRTRRRSSERV